MNANDPIRSNFFVKIIQNFLTKIFQHPEYYNKYYRIRNRNRHGQILF
jgi:hypothetical protein